MSHQQKLFTNADKRRVVTDTLKQPRWQKRTDTEIALALDVSRTYVGQIRGQLEIEGTIPSRPQREVFRGGTTYLMDIRKDNMMNESKGTDPLEGLVESPPPPPPDQQPAVLTTTAATPPPPPPPPTPTITAAIIAQEFPGIEYRDVCRIVVEATAKNKASVRGLSGDITAQLVEWGVSEKGFDPNNEYTSQYVGRALQKIIKDRSYKDSAGNHVFYRDEVETQTGWTVQIVPPGAGRIYLILPVNLVDRRCQEHNEARKKSQKSQKSQKAQKTLFRKVHSEKAARHITTDISKMALIGRALLAAARQGEISGSLSLFVKKIAPNLVSLIPDFDKHSNTVVRLCLLGRHPGGRKALGVIVEGGYAVAHIGHNNYRLYPTTAAPKEPSPDPESPKQGPLGDMALVPRAMSAMIREFCPGGKLTKGFRGDLSSLIKTLDPDGAQEITADSLRVAFASLSSMGFSIQDKDKGEVGIILRLSTDQILQQLPAFLPPDKLQQLQDLVEDLVGG